jgi:hypothetical protein
MNLLLVTDSVKEAMARISKTRDRAVRSAPPQGKDETFLAAT